MARVRGRRLLALFATLAVFSPAVPYAAQVPALGPLQPAAYELFASFDEPALLSPRVAHTPAVPQPAVDAGAAHSIELTRHTWWVAATAPDPRLVGSGASSSSGPRAPPAPSRAHEAGASTH